MAVLGKTAPERDQEHHQRRPDDPDHARPAAWRRRHEAADRVAGARAATTSAASTSARPRSIIEPSTGAVAGHRAEHDVPDRRQGPDRASITQVNWDVDQKYGGSGGFQFGSTAKMFASSRALEHGRRRSTARSTPKAGRGNRAVYTTDFPDEQRPVRPAAPRPGRSTTTTPSAAGRYLQKATAKSVNTAFASLALKLGACNVRQTR